MTIKLIGIKLLKRNIKDIDLLLIKKLTTKNTKF